jgi:hypothetical protein
MSLIKFETENNEGFGIYIEKLLCDFYQIPFQTTRQKLLTISPEHETKIMSDIAKVVPHIPYKLTEHVGGKNTKVDYMCERDKTLSLKSLMTSTRVCPQTIGQTTLRKIGAYFGVSFQDGMEFKKYMENSLSSALDHYSQYTFTCDVTVVLLFAKKKAYVITKQDGVQPRMKTGKYALNVSSDNWNESATVHHHKEEGKNERPISIGEFQVHAHRDSPKFRFNIENLLAHDIVEGLLVQTVSFDNKYNIKSNIACPRKDKIEEKKEETRPCPAGKILNPATNRYVKESGKIGQALLRGLENLKM